METLGLTSDEESNISHPYAQRNRHNKPVSVPNGDARVTHKCLIAERLEKVNEDCDVHAKYD
jgi:hypothetical protein